MKYNFYLQHEVVRIVRELPNPFERYRVERYLSLVIRWQISSKRSWTRNGQTAVSVVLLSNKKMGENV